MIIYSTAIREMGIALLPPRIFEILAFQEISKEMEKQYVS